MQKAKLFFYGKVQLLQCCSCCVPQPVLLFQAPVFQHWQNEWNEMSIYLGNGEGLKLLWSTQGSLFAFFFLFFFPFLCFLFFLREKKKITNLKCSSILFTLACKFGSSMSCRIPDSHRLAEKGRHFWGLSSLTPCSEHVHQSKLHRSMSWQVLSIFKDRLYTASLGSLFQC